MTANTPTTYYKDSDAVKKHCKKNFEKIEEDCAKEDASKKTNSRMSFRKLLGKKYNDHKSTLKKGGTDNKSWMADHCDFLWIAPTATGHQEFLAKVDNLKNDVAEAVDQVLGKAMDKITDTALDLAKKKAVDMAERAGARWFVAAGGAAVGGVGGLVTEGIATVWNIADMAYTGVQVTKAGYDAVKEIGALKEMTADFKKVGTELERLGRQAKEDPQRAIADFQQGMAKLNACMRARRCSLVPYNKTESPGGCCPGQTGHHLIPDTAVKNAGCPGYSRETAPTVCAEGVGNGVGGSHQAMHDDLKKRMSDYARNAQSLDISYPDYRKIAVSTFMKQFPESLCNPNCLKAQLDAYYNCAGKTLNVDAGKGKVKLQQG